MSPKITLGTTGERFKDEGWAKLVKKISYHRNIRLKINGL